MRQLRFFFHFYDPVSQTVPFIFFQYKKKALLFDKWSVVEEVRKWGWLNCISLFMIESLGSICRLAQRFVFHFRGKDGQVGNMSVLVVHPPSLLSIIDNVSSLMCTLIGNYILCLSRLVYISNQFQIDFKQIELCGMCWPFKTNLKLMFF